MKTYIKILSLLVAMLVAGCGSQYSANLLVDEFSDERVCRVKQEDTFGEEVANEYFGNVVTHDFIAEMRSDGPRVGLHGRFGIVFGDVQVRVDNNPTVLITAKDTPVDYGGDDVDVEIPTIKLPNVSEEDQKAYEESVREMTKNIGAIGAVASPYRVLTGDKARNLLNQIKNGRVLKFRTIGINQATTNTATVEIDDELKNALRKCNLI